MENSCNLPRWFNEINNRDDLDAMKTELYKESGMIRDKEHKRLDNLRSACSNIDERIKDVMSAVFGVDVDTINEDSSQDNIEGWESIRTLDLIVALEEEFGVTIPLEEVGNMTNFRYIKLMIDELTA